METKAEQTQSVLDRALLSRRAALAARSTTFGQLKEDSGIGPFGAYVGLPQLPAINYIDFKPATKNAMTHQSIS